MITTIATEMKYHLNGKEVYGYDNEILFTASLVNAIEIAKVKYLIPCISSEYFDEFILKTKSTLTTIEKFIYYAWLYFSLSIFLDIIGNKEQQIKAAENSSASKKNISKSSSGRIGKYDASFKNREEAYKMLANAGYVKSNTISRDGLETEWREITVKTNEFGVFR